jgi:hypothetical protein
LPPKTSCSFSLPLRLFIDFNQPVDHFVVDRVVYFYEMFDRAQSFNIPLDSWSTASEAVLQESNSLLKRAAYENRSFNSGSTYNCPSSNATFCSCTAHSCSCNTLSQSCNSCVCCSNSCFCSCNSCVCDCISMACCSNSLCHV